MYIAFITVKNLTFRALLNLFSSSLSAWIPNNNDILYSQIIKAYQDCKVLLAKKILQTRSNIYLSLDLWTLDNSIIFIAIVAHHINDNSQLQTILIGLCRVIGSHSGEVIRKQVVDFIQEYGIEKKLRYCVFDNATSNETCVMAIFKAI